MPEADRARTSRAARKQPDRVGQPARTPEETAALVHLPVPERHDTPWSVDPARVGDVDEWGRSENMRALARKLYAPLYEKWFRVEWEGLEKIPTEGGALIVANHAAPSRPTPRRSCTASRPSSSGRCTASPTSTSSGSRSSARCGRAPAAWSPTPTTPTACSASSSSSCWCSPRASKGPGKTYNERYRLRRFGRGGFVEIAMRAGVPIVPIAVVGAEESMPILFKIPALSKALGLPYAPITANMLLLGPLGVVGYFPAKFKLRVLDPVSFDDVEPDQLRYSRSRIMDESEAIRQRIQGELYDMLRHRRSIWFG